MALNRAQADLQQAQKELTRYELQNIKPQELQLAQQKVNVAREEAKKPKEVERELKLIAQITAQKRAI